MGRGWLDDVWVGGVGMLEPDANSRLGSGWGAGRGMRAGTGHAAVERASVRAEGWAAVPGLVGRR